MSEGVSRGFSARFRAIIELAQDEARRCNRPLDDEHILIGLVAEGESDAAKLVAVRGLSADDMRARIPRSDVEIPPTARIPFSPSVEPPRRAKSEVASGRSFVSAGQMLVGLVEFTPSAKEAIERAQAEARRRSSFVSAEHLLLGLVDNGGTAAMVLGALPDGHDLRAYLVALVDNVSN